MQWLKNHNEQAMPTKYMERALALAEQARYLAPPNPWVGCVLVKDDRIVGEGFTQVPGGDHAEIGALQQAGEAARGATAYVALEPCSHHGRTPPCTDALIRSGIHKVIVALEDPDQRVSGQGVATLREAGIVVEVGMLADLAKESLRPYLHHRRTGRAYCVAKAAVSIDGRMAAADGTSQWITGDRARADAHRLRAQSQAVMIGVGTALKDQPSLTVRHFQANGVKHPLRVVLDRAGRLPSEGPLFDTTLAQTLIVTTSRSSAETHNRWKQTGVEVMVLSEIDLKAVLEDLGRRGVLQVLVEGGPTLLSSLLKEKLIDQLALYVGPRILGDKGRSLFAGLDVATITDAPTLTLQGCEQLGDTVRMDYRL